MPAAESMTAAVAWPIPARWLTVTEAAAYFGRSVSWMNKALEHFDEQGHRLGWIPWVRIQPDGTFERSSEMSFTPGQRASAERRVDRRVLDAISDRLSGGDCVDQESLHVWAEQVVAGAQRSTRGSAPRVGQRKHRPL
jgi:hypothetical protein